jgi:hypothetical protein
MDALVENSKNKVRTKFMQNIILGSMDRSSCCNMEKKNSHVFHVPSYSRVNYCTQYISNYDRRKNRENFNHAKKILYKMYNDGNIDNNQYNTLMQYFLSAYIEREISNILTGFLKKSFLRMLGR